MLWNVARTNNAFEPEQTRPSKPSATQASLRVRSNRVERAIRTTLSFSVLAEKTEAAQILLHELEVANACYWLTYKLVADQYAGAESACCRRMTVVGR